jgi:predicted Zn-dependent protease
MAIDKSRTSPFMKTMIILLAGTFVVGIGFAGLSGITSCTPNAPLLPSSGTTASTNTTASLQAIDARYSAAVQAREASITADPKNYDLLVAQGNDYSDWTSQVLQSTQKETTQAVTLAQSAASFYERALAIKAGDPNVTTDYAIALFYSGDVTKAIATGEQLRKADPTFSPIVFNLGIFYANSGAADGLTKAKAALNDYLKMDPNGSNAANAKTVLSQLAAASAATTSSATTSAP